MKARASNYFPSSFIRVTRMKMNDIDFSLGFARALSSIGNKSFACARRTSMKLMELLDRSG